MSAPKTTAMRVAMAAILRLNRNASTSSGIANGSFQLSSVKLCQTRLKRPFGSLKLNATITKIGMKR